MYRSNGKLYKAEGIILSRRNVGEADRILTIFTREYGKIRCVAKGIRRVSSRRAPHLEIFTRVGLMIHRGGSMDSVTEATPIDVYQHLRQDLERVSMAYFYCELISVLLAEHQEHADVYLLLCTTLSNLDTQTGTLDPMVFREFTLELLWTLGFLPRGQRLQGEKLQSFVENIAERRLRTPKLVRQLL